MSNLKRWQRLETPAWPAFGNLFNLRDELDRFFSGPFGDTAGTSQPWSVWNTPIDLFEDQDSVTVKAELPGMKKEDIEVSLHNGELSISGERKSEEKFADAETYRAERFVGRFHRTIALPAEVKADQVNAQYQDGILTVTLPKTEQAKPKQVEIKEPNQSAIQLAGGRFPPAPNQNTTQKEKTNEHSHQSGKCRGHPHSIRGTGPLPPAGRQHL